MEIPVAGTEIPAALTALFGIVLALALAGLVSSCLYQLRAWRRRRRQRHAATKTTEQ